MCKAASQRRDTAVGFSGQGGAGTARVVLAQPGENPWLSLAETPMEELGAGIAWAMWGRPWPGKSEQGAVQAEAGDASPPTGLVSPRALRAEQLP